MNGAELVPARAYLEAVSSPRAWIELMGPAVELAKAVAGTEFVPRAMRSNVAAIAAAILYGDEIGLGPMQSLARIAVIDGRPSLAAETQRALILAAGHSLWREQATVTAVTWAGKRRDSDVTERVTWTMDDARRAGLAGRQNWRSYPRAMLSARASADLARAIFADVIGGMAATEELEAEGLESLPAGAAENVAGTADAPATRRRRRPSTRTATATTSAAVPAEALERPALPGEEGAPAMGDQQRRLMMRLLRERGITTQAGRHRYVGEVLGRKVTSSADLTADEAAAVIGRLEAEPAAEPPPAAEEGPEGDHRAEAIRPEVLTGEPVRLPLPGEEEQAALPLEEGP